MRRFDLFEIADLPSCPDWLRSAMTGYLQTVIERFEPYRAAAAPIAELMQSTGTRQIVDLASGAGGPWPGLRERIAEFGTEAPEVILTDLRPDPAARKRLEDEPGITYRPDSVSAVDVAPNLHGVRTMFSALHHFDRAGVRSIMRSAQDDRVGFVAVEATHRSVAGVLTTLAVPLLVLGLMPSVRPRSMRALWLTYLPPLLPLVIWWDGFVSTLRTYTVAELEAIADEIASPHYRWTVREVPVEGAPIPSLQLIGQPASQAPPGS